MDQKVYTIITFAPVQGFIENSRKLRDLYGSSCILSFLARTLCDAVIARKEEGYILISPAVINLTQGTPNQIIIEGKEPFPKEQTQAVFNNAWKAIVEISRTEIESLLPQYTYHWQRNWTAWANNAWEFFYAAGEKGETITDVRQKSNEIKRRRNWIGINWVGESSTLSGRDAVAWYGMADQINPKTVKMSEIDDHIKKFYQELSQELSESILDEKEQLNIPELIKRLITLYPVARKLNLQNTFPKVEIPESFKDINRKENKLWTGWFQGDGDRIGDYFKNLVKQGKNERDELEKFSKAMIEWGEKFEKEFPHQNLINSQFSDKISLEGRIIYAGGDDFLGVLYQKEGKKTNLLNCLNWFDKFPQIWQEHQQPITVSVGLVWAAPNVPLRDVLQHSHQAEQVAKKTGRDRLALRILFNSGNYLECTLPWWLLNLEKLIPSMTKTPKNLLESYQENTWQKLAEDVSTLEARHGFYVKKNTKKLEINIALGLIEIYIGKEYKTILGDLNNWWNKYNDKNELIFTGLLGNYSESIYKTDSQSSREYKISQTFNNWVINLAKVGYHLCQ